MKTHPKPLPLWRGFAGIADNEGVSKLNGANLLLTFCHSLKE